MRILTSGLIVILLILVIYFNWFAEGPQQDTQDADLREEKPIILQNPELFDFRNNRLSSQIKAKMAKVYESTDLTLLTQIDGTVYSENQTEPPTRIFAQSGSINGKIKLITVWGDVRIVFANGQRLYTEKLNLDQNKQLLYNRVAVLVVSDREKINADDMLYDLKTRILTLSGPKAWIETGF